MAGWDSTQEQLAQKLQKQSGLGHVNVQALCSLGEATGYQAVEI
jgi:hypothetical protein